MKEIIVKLKDGNISIETAGFKGSSCTKETEGLIQKLGMALKSDKKPEFYQQIVGENAVKRG